jgi:hypothetical protein
LIDRELVLRKLDAVRNHAARLAAKLPATAGILSGDETWQEQTEGMDSVSLPVSRLQCRILVQRLLAARSGPP